MNTTEFLTTGQAATLCSVTRNAVFKWIQSGHLKAKRTAGGHYRIDRRDLDRLTTRTEQGPAQGEQAISQPPFQYCWEYNGNGKTQEACKNCAVYLLRAMRCYEVAKLAPDVHHAKLYCSNHCEDCDYYKEMHGKKANVLVVTNDRILTEDLLAHAEEASFNLEITDCEYTCSAIVNHFKPDFVIIDCILGRNISQQMSSHIMKDPRIPYVRVVLAGKKDEFSRECNSEVFARMTRPFSVESISEFVNLANCSAGT